MDENLLLAKLLGGLRQPYEQMPRDAYRNNPNELGMQDILPDPSGALEDSIDDGAARLLREQAERQADIERKREDIVKYGEMANDMAYPEEARRNFSNIRDTSQRILGVLLRASGLEKSI